MFYARLDYIRSSPDVNTLPARIITEVFLKVSELLPKGLVLEEYVK